MTERIACHRLQVDPVLHRFIEEQVLPGINVSSADFWRGFDALAHDLRPRNEALLAERERLQYELDEWHSDYPGPVFNTVTYQKFLKSIGYLVEQPTQVQVNTRNVDAELAQLAGPQLVVPALNARYALNAANARWGSLYDALYGTDVIPETDGAEKTSHYNPVRGQRVVDYARGVLDQTAPLAQSSHRQACGYWVEQGQLVVALQDGQRTSLAQPERLVGYRGDAAAPNVVLLRNHGLHLEIVIDRSTPVGAADPAGVSDLVLEAALSTIVDLEDSIVAVDAEDKVNAYANWLGLVQGTLTETVDKGGRSFTRRLNPDRSYTAPDGSSLRLHGRALLFVRNVGHLMTNPAILYEDGKEIYEGVMDALITVAIAMRDLQRTPDSPWRNSRTGSIYVVKPKMHGPDEVAFADDLFARVEALLGLPPHTVKLGIMDEERRTSINLKACIAAAANRVAFINTGFLDRTGDEIHSVMFAGVVLRKSDMKNSTWLAAYERNNVIVGLACGMHGRGQIGKGMWAMPDRMAAMMEQKIAHPLAGANTAWVPSPTAATLHALHYHAVDVMAVQRELLKVNEKTESRVMLDGLLRVPVLVQPNWVVGEVFEELNNNVQSILGYVSRWVDQGIGCSKVPDLHNVGLMEDRATLRISSQHIANWMQHDLITEEDVRTSFAQMAEVVDQQNAHDPLYRPMFNHYTTSFAYRAAVDLVIKGLDQPNGYTEPLLHAWRRRAKDRFK